ncbi:pentapeptide repeat-containing protein [Nocardia sp. NPDC003482]
MTGRKKHGSTRITLAGGFVRGGKAITRRTATIGLLWSVVAALTLSLALAVTAYWLLTRSIETDEHAKAAPADLTKLSLTVVAGVGGVVALVIAYRRQRDLEQGRFVERFGAAAAQLGSADVAVRIAGVYAMAGVADESRGLRRQQCIDVLCGYLRLPFDAGHGSSGRTKFVVKAPRFERGRVRGETEEHVEYRQNDHEVRATIVRVIADHLRDSAEYSWSASEFDLRTAYLEDVDFSTATFAGIVRFGHATFSGPTSFMDATFSDTVWFNDVTFSGTVGFEFATFSSALFSNATFSDTADFFAVTFSDNTWFDGAIFCNNARFDHATFSESAWFDGVTFSDTADFNDVTFSGVAEFGRATFSSATSFAKAHFSGSRTSFANPKRWGPPAPTFDWDEDVAQKPANLQPKDWPPVVKNDPQGHSGDGRCGGPPRPVQGRTGPR